MFGPHSRLRAEATLLLAEGLPELAAMAGNVLRAVEFYDRGLAEVEAEWRQVMILQAK